MEESLFWIHNEGNVILSSIDIIKNINIIYWIFTFIHTLATIPGTILGTDYNSLKQTVRESVEDRLITEWN